MVKAFICCTREDVRLGKRLRGELVRMRIPPAAGRTEGHARETHEFGLGIFRPNQTEADLGKAASGSLEEADALIVICTPAAARVAGISEAISRFRQRKPSGQVLCLIAAGQPRGSMMAGLESRECLPEAVRAAASKPNSTGAMRIIADIRPGHGEFAAAVCAIAAVISDAPVGDLVRHQARRSLIRRLSVAAACLLVIGAAVGGMTIRKEMQQAAKAAALRDLALAAHSALDEGDLRGALRAIVEIGADLPQGRSAPGLPPEAVTALSRIALDTRLLAEMPVPTGDVATLRLLPTGVLAAVEPGGRTHLIDLGTKDVTTVYDPPQATHTRISGDGETLWTAHFEPVQRDETGGEFAPLIFEEAELATGDVRLVTAVQSVPADGGAAEISPDGWLFAADLGPGAGDETVIGVFHREAQALAGILTLPSDKAELSFAGPEHLLVRTDPPGRWSRAPGLYVWGIGDEKARTLRYPGDDPVCPGTPVLRNLPDPVVSISPDGREVALSLPSADRTGCLLRWALPSGDPKPALPTPVTPSHMTVLAAGGPYAVKSGVGKAWIVSGEAGEPAMPLTSCAHDAEVILLGEPAGGLVLCIEPSGRGALVRLGSVVVWEGMFHAGEVTAMAFDEPSGRLFTIGSDARLRIWDAGKRLLIPVSAAHGPDVSVMPSGEVLLATADEARVLTARGGATGSVSHLGDLPGTVAEVLPLSGKFAGIYSREGPDEQFSILDLASDGETARLVTRYPGLRSGASASPSGRRFLIVEAAGRAIWGDGATGGPLTRIELVGPRPILSGVAGDRAYAIVATDAVTEDPERRNLFLYTGGDGVTPGLVGEWQARSVALRMSPLGDRVVAIIDRALPARSALALIDLKSGAETQIASFLSGVHDVRFSPDGRYVSLLPQSGADVIDARGEPVTGGLIAKADSGDPVRHLKNVRAGELLAWAQDGNMLGYGRGNLERTRSGRVLCPELIGPDATNFAVDPSGTRIAFQEEREGKGPFVVVADLETCSALTRAGADLAGKPPVFVGRDAVWLSLDHGIAVLQLELDPLRMLQVAMDRSARLESGGGP